MGNDFQFYARKLDDEIKKLPTLQQVMDSNKDAYFHVFDAVNRLRDVVKYIGPKIVEEYLWHQQVRMLEFSLNDNPHFRLGLLGSCENVVVEDDTRGVAGFGFDEELDYENKEAKPQMIIYYMNGVTTDLLLFDAEKWRNGLNEFFNISEVE